jgi:glycosyltransferase involved in cell wall biosynthesis
VSAAPTEPKLRRRSPPTSQTVRGVLDLRSVGVARYARQLAEALADERVDYPISHRFGRGGATHVHLANSSRLLLHRVRRPGDPLIVTVHDVVPRTRSLLPLYRALVYPRLARSTAAVVVHTTVAADMLIRETGALRRLEVIPHPAPRPSEMDRNEARDTLGWPSDRLIAVLPGVVRSVKCVDEALTAIDAQDTWRIALAGSLADRRLARVAESRGALLLSSPDDRDYERAIVAADAILCLRSSSVGETNGPLLDALGAGRAVLATPTGSIPEVAGDAVLYCDATAPSIRDALAELTEPLARHELERAAACRASALTWRSSARLHAALFQELIGA